MFIYKKKGDCYTWSEISLANHISTTILIYFAFNSLPSRHSFYLLPYFFFLQQVASNEPMTPLKRQEISFKVKQI